MEEIIKLIMNYGTGIAVIALFIIDWWKNKNKINETLQQNSKMLEEMKVSNENTSKALDILLATDSRIEKKIDCIKEKADITKK